MVSGYQGLVSHYHIPHPSHTHIPLRAATTYKGHCTCLLKGVQRSRGKADRTNNLLCPMVSDLHASCEEIDTAIIPDNKYRHAPSVSLARQPKPPQKGTRVSVSTTQSRPGGPARPVGSSHHSQGPQRRETQLRPRHHHRHEIAIYNTHARIRSTPTHVSSFMVAPLVVSRAPLDGAEGNQSFRLRGTNLTVYCEGK